MKLTSIIFLFSLASVLSSCTTYRMQRSIDEANAAVGDTQLDAQAIQSAITFERTACFGRCPAFKFVWNTDNSVSLKLTRPFQDGPLSSLQLGEFHASLHPTRAKQYAEAINSAAELCRYSSLDDEYDNPRVTDLPATITVINNKQVKARYGGPDLNTLYSAIQIILDETEWVATE